jgi:hypothetical protein
MDLAKSLHPSAATRFRTAAFVVLAALAIWALNFIPPFDNELWLPTLLFGPLLTGVVMRLRGWPWRLGAASWALTAVISLFWDWFLFSEDQVFHLVLTIMLPALVALGAALGRGIASLQLHVSRTRR